MQTVQTPKERNEKLLQEIEIRAKMPPKKPKGKGKGGKAKSKGVAASPANNALPYGDVVNRKQMEVKVMEQKQRIAELRAENAQLKRQHDKSERDTHEFVAYFQKGEPREVTVKTRASMWSEDTCSLSLALLRSFAIELT